MTETVTHRGYEIHLTFVALTGSWFAVYTLPEHGKRWRYSRDRKNALRTATDDIDEFLLDAVK